MNREATDYWEFAEAAFTYAHANLTGEACDRDDPCRKPEMHGVTWTCRVHWTARLVMAAYDRLIAEHISQKAHSAK